ncbi:MAG: glycosyltransferase family 2 protein [Acidimicrobiales bacterium]
MARGLGSVSVVIPTYDRAERLHRLLTALAAQRGSGPFEVVVADDCSPDDTVPRTRALAAEVPYQLVVLASPVNAGPAAARNRGWKAASGEGIVFTDDDCVPDPGWLASMVDGLQDADIVVGRTRPPKEQLGRIGPFSSYLDIGHDGSFSTCNVAYRRGVLESLGGFDEIRFRVPNGEDTDLGLRARRAGFSEAYREDALVWHDVRSSDFAGHLRRVRHLEGLVALVSAHPDARRSLNAGWFLRSVDKAVLIAWAAAAVTAIRPRSRTARLLAAGAGALYVRQFGKSHYPARSRWEWIRAVPLGFVADSWAVVVMIRASARYRTLLL